MQAHPPVTPAQVAAVPAASPSTSIPTATHSTKPSAAATTNLPAATTAPHANTFTIIRNIAITVILNETTVILIACLLFRASVASRGISSTIVMPDPIGHPQTSSHLQ